MFFKFLPKDFDFFSLFEKQAGYAVEAAAYLKEVVSKGALDEGRLKKMHAIEHQGDEVAHAIIAQLNKTFITPFEREDIHALTMQLDDVIDMLYTIANRLRVYKITKVSKDLIEFASVIEESVRCIASAIKGLRNEKNTKPVSESCIEINRLENVGDLMRDKAVEELFRTEKDPLMVIKWKDIYQDAETVLDICEDVAHVVESILVKQA
jgi:predicted phosphate transport protein (TIGR00153 family)